MTTDTTALSVEEIVIEIQNGRSDLYVDLWERVQAFVRQQVARSHALRRVEFDDLYNTGFIALVSAVKTFIPGSASFLHWFRYYLKSGFAIAGGYRTARNRLDPLNNALSLSEPLAEDGDPDYTLESLVADPAASDAIEAVEEDVYIKQLHDALEGILKTIPEPDADILRKKYFNGDSIKNIAVERGVSYSYIAAKERNAVRTLRRNAYLRKGQAFREFLEDITPYYKHVGVDQFNTTQTSAVEYVVLQRERYAEQHKEKQSKGI